MLDGMPREYDERDRGNEWPRVTTYAIVMNTILGKP
jgi:hypothetical protein